MSGIDMNSLQDAIKKAMNEILTGEEFRSAFNDIGASMQSHVLGEIEGARYDFTQTGRFISALEEESPKTNSYKNQFGGKITVGFGELAKMMTLYRAPQTATFRFGNETEQIHLRGETQMPEWIIAEFGRTGSRFNSDPVPAQFSFTYTPRPEKRFLYGPSLDRVGEKPIFFMRNYDESTRGMKAGLWTQAVNDYYNKNGDDANYRLLRRSAQQSMNRYREHSGIAPQHVFSKGLEDAKPFIQSRIDQAFQNIGFERR